MDNRLAVIHLDTIQLVSSANLQQNCLLLISLLSIRGVRVEHFSYPTHTRWCLPVSVP